eukprot:1156877-Pelagomonas_calceolata.AAC.2
MISNADLKHQPADHGVLLMPACSWLRELDARNTGALDFAVHSHKCAVPLWSCRILWAQTPRQGFVKNGRLSVASCHAGATFFAVCSHTCAVPPWSCRVLWAQTSRQGFQNCINASKWVLHRCRFEHDLDPVSKKALEGPCEQGCM